MRLSLSFRFDGGRIAEFDNVTRLEVQDYVFNGQLGPEKALVVWDTAYELRLVSDIQMTVHSS